ncbi:MAG TPA: DUF3072 domain-containing protein [Solirubrobacteraceae bacterium]|nr:DUF3072 domain-containing protein [Solirubrobacteraceae bacterium]
MTDSQLNQPHQDPSASADGNQPMTEDQRAQIASLGGAEAAPDRELTRAEAAQLIDSLSHRTGREGD